MQVFDNNMRRASRRASLRRGSISALPQKSAEIPWDIFERLSMPFLFCQAAAIVSSHLLHALNISSISTFAVFVWFALATVGAVLFYHFVKLLEAAHFVSQHLPHGAQGLWAVVHCAHWIALGELEWIPFAVLRKSLDLNLLGAARLTQIFLPLVRRAHGRVVFLTSGLNRVPSPVRGIQCATQAAVDCFAACLRQEMRTRGVDVSVVAAGEFSPGNGWLNETELRDQAKQMWNQLSSEQKKTYGEDYYEAAMTSVEKYSREAADIQPTLRVLIDAVTRTFPMARYTPVTAKEKLQIFLAEHLAPSLYESVYGEQKKFVY
ncbi:GL17387 [Drosophila persimilis]|uniref:GL17387 n=1 Tax=Drosophila persimilis TaxID=7234 RepID=B4GGQ0_DROPE|nr:GL17387 [Drosophila persimilis]